MVLLVYWGLKNLPLTSPFSGIKPAKKKRKAKLYNNRKSEDNDVAPIINNDQLDLGQENP